MNQIKLYKEEEYLYAGAFGFIPTLTLYLRETTDDNLPLVLVIPGGGYRMVSPTEGEIVAKRFGKLGYHAAVLTYTTNLVGIAPLKELPLKDLERALRYLSEHAEELHVDARRIILCGFSAGAHLAATCCVHGRIRPAAAILSYPVITSGKYAHRDSFTALLGEDMTQNELDYYSLERHVDDKTPPCFLWQTATDELVPVENSYLFADALRNAGVPFAHHVFSHGQHGLSLSNELWASGSFGEPYTMDQTMRVMDRVKDGTILLQEPARSELLHMFCGEDHARRTPIPEVSVWPELADAFLRFTLRLNGGKL
jgi:acetyl esterase/lipase